MCWRGEGRPDTILSTGGEVSWLSNFKVPRREGMVQVVLDLHAFTAMLLSFGRGTYFV